MPVTTLFDIRNFLDRLTPAKGKNRYVCPVCEGDNLTFDLDDYQGYTCWNDESDQHRAEIREAISPWVEVVRENGNVAPRIVSPRKTKKQSAPPLPALPEHLILARLPEPATDQPQAQQRPDRKRGQVLVTIYRYSDSQWVERTQWTNPDKPKGYSKEFFPWHLGTDGKPVCKRGEAEWMPYRWDEALAAIRSSTANTLIVCEGEGCVEAYRGLGYAATTFQGSKWSEADLRAFAQLVKPHGITIAFHPDNDTTGAEKAGRLSKACAAVGVPCLLLCPANLCEDLPESGDVVDCLKVMSAEDYIKRLEAEIHAAAAERRQQAIEQHQADEEEKRRGQTPAEIAAEIAEDYRNRLAWNDEAGLWYRYEAEFAGVWSLESDTAIGAVVLAEFENRMGLSYKASHIEECIKILKWKLLVRHWETPKHLLPFQNGVMNIQTGEFHDHAPGYRFTWTLPRQHDPQASDWGTIEQWMDEATDGSAKLKNILLCWLNACLKGRSDLQRFLHLTGAGGTGKGTFIRLAVRLVGEKNNHSSNLADWCGNRFETVNAYKKRLLTFADEDKYSGGLGNFKKVTGGDAIRGEIKRRQAFDFVFDGMVMLASNYPIFSGDTSSGIYRRLLMVPFNKIIPPAKRRNLDQEFEPELAALTNYVLSIPDEVVSATLRQSIDQAPEVIERSWDWRMRQDNVAAWLNECVVQAPLTVGERVGNDREDISTLFGSYYRYCEKTGSRPKGSREFSPALLELCNNDPALNWGLQKKRESSGFVIYGLRLRRPELDASLPYCLEALADVGSTAHVGSDVGSHVEPETLLQAGYVGSVGSNELELDFKKQNEAISNDFSIVQSEPDNDLPSCTSYTSQPESEIETIQSDPTVQDAAPYTGSKPALLSPERLKSAVATIQAADSQEKLNRAYNRYRKCTRAQQQQIMAALGEAGLIRFCQLVQDFKSTDVENCRHRLEDFLTRPDYEKVVKQYGLAIVSLATERLSETSRRDVQRFEAFLLRNEI
ncbi:phage/plasmid primase, P4 family [Leptolyngbya sp. GB1-A1]|uniref:phage/plasmid primase, P4 family n=1 Tax=Leptolyngbya sp. GB1-A1 TaxID=2933908 RepID=UPI0032995410